MSIALNSVNPLALEIMSLTRDELIKALYRMEKEGGSFASKLAAAWFRADSSNSEKLMIAFKDLIYRYHLENQKVEQKQLLKHTNKSKVKKNVAQNEKEVIILNYS